MSAGASAEAAISQVNDLIRHHPAAGGRELLELSTAKFKLPKYRCPTPRKSASSSWMTKPAKPAAVAPAVEPDDSPADLTTTECYDPPTIDPHGFDATEYDWVPVKRKRRVDGWSNEKQRNFIGHLADEGSVNEAARLVGMSVQSCYRLRRAPGAENFARAWDAAIGEAAKRLLDVAFERATIGVEVPVFDHEGVRIATRHRPSDRLLMFLLRTRLGNRLGLTDRDDSRAADARSDRSAVALPTVAQAMIALEPASIPAPHLTMTPEELTHAVQLAEIADGEVPHWLRDLPVVPAPPAHQKPVSPLGEEFERAIEEMKANAAGAFPSMAPLYAHIPMKGEAPKRRRSR